MRYASRVMNTATPLSTEGKTEEIQTGTKSKKGSSVLDSALSFAAHAASKYNLRRLGLLITYSGLSLSLSKALFTCLVRGMKPHSNPTIPIDVKYEVGLTPSRVGCFGVRPNSSRTEGGRNA